VGNVAKGRIIKNIFPQKQEDNANVITRYKINSHQRRVRIDLVDRQSYIKYQTLTDFLIKRKIELRHLEGIAVGEAAVAMFWQLNTIDTILIYLGRVKNNVDEKEIISAMETLQVSLEKQPIPISEIDSKMETSPFSLGIIALAGKLKPDTAMPIDNNIPPDTTNKQIASKVYILRKTGKLSDNIFPMVRKDKVYLAKRPTGWKPKIERKKRAAEKGNNE
jgi:hypothetical protein